MALAPLYAPLFRTAGPVRIEETGPCFGPVFLNFKGKLLVTGFGKPLPVFYSFIAETDVQSLNGMGDAPTEMRSTPAAAIA